jgi:hypothetical protein
MEIVSIFGKNLFAIKHTGEEKDEFSKLFELWQDPEYLEDFFENNKDDLGNGFWGSISIEKAIFKTIDYAKEFEETLLDLSEKSSSGQIDELRIIFKPLHNTQYQTTSFKKSKAKQTWLRLYALRVEENAYIITGGTIKLTQKMQDREHTHLELEKLEKCKRFLIEQGIVDVDGVIEEIES